MKKSNPKGEISKRLVFVIAILLSIMGVAGIFAFAATTGQNKDLSNSYKVGPWVITIPKL